MFCNRKRRVSLVSINILLTAYTHGQSSHSKEMESTEILILCSFTCAHTFITAVVNFWSDWHDHFGTSTTFSAINLPLVAEN